MLSNHLLILRPQQLPLQRRRPPHHAKTGYKKQRELDNVPERIKRLEDEQKALQLAQREAAIETELLQTLERWEVLSYSRVHYLFCSCSRNFSLG